MFDPEIVEKPFQVKEIVFRDRLIWVPYLMIVSTDQEDFMLHWGNTCIRTFEDDQYDHIELKEDESCRAMVFDDDLMDMFEDYWYPLRYDPIVDEATLNWYINKEVASETTDLDDEFKEFFDES